MPIANIQDAREVEGSLRDILAASSADAASASIRTLFVETLDFDYAGQLVPLNGADTNLPADARLLARRDGISALYVPLDEADGNNVTSAVASAAAKVIGDTIADEPLLLFTSRDHDQLHVIYPDLSGSRPALQRMVAHREQPRRTVVQQIANLWNDYGVLGKPLGEAVRRAFSVQPVTDAFFKDYKAAYDDAVALLADQLEQQDAEQFAQTLFNRLLFTQFVSRKGWLKFNGDTDYLNALWRDYHADDKQTNFHRDRLRTLFFAGLNNPQSQNLSVGVQPLIGEVPFLNGGLFEETDLDRRAVNAVPDAALAPMLGDGSESGLFNRYNFTVTEATPLDTEVAVDPEMLGKLFEETVNERHSNGAYYTPRPVVAFMCREAIKGYLSGEGIAGLNDTKIADLIDRQETAGITPQQALEIANAVFGMKAVDPACGSGAFLLGMLQEIIAVNATLINAGHSSESLYRQKLDIITNNIYGADKDALAVSTAMLRLWLSLAVDYDGDGPPDPLPNLDLKLVVGDAIAGPDPRMVTDSAAAPNAQQMDFTTSGIDDSGLRANIAAYTNAQGQYKTALKANVEAVKADLRRRIPGAAPAGVIEWRIDFADVVLNGGFDVVIANPPYVVAKDKRLREMYKEGVYGRMNLYGLFIQRSLQLLKDGGQLQFINPRTLLTDRYFTNLRKVIRRDSELRGVVLIADRHNTFERVLQECIILHLSKSSNPAPSYQVATRAISVPEDLNTQQFTVQGHSGQVLLNDEYDGAFYIGTTDFDYQVLQRMDAVGVRLDAWGLKAETGKIQFDKYREYAQPNGTKGDCRLIWAENVQRYALAPTVRRVGKEWLKKSITGVISPSITGEGIVTQRVTANEQPRRIIATLMRPEDTGTERVYSENHTNFIPLGKNNNGYFILATLNSSPVEFLFRRLNSNTQVSAGELNALPFPPLPDDKTLAEIHSLVSDLLNWNGVECTLENLKQALEHEDRLDLIIGSLYGFSPGEVAQIQATLPSHRFVYDPSTAEEDAALLRAMEEADLNDRASLSEVREVLRAPDDC